MRGPIALSSLLLLNAVACAPERGPGVTALPLTNGSFNPQNDDDDGDDDDDDDDTANSTPTENDPTNNTPTESDPTNSTLTGTGPSLPTNVTEDDPTDPTNSTPTTVTDTTPPDDTTLPQTTVDDDTNPLECEPSSYDIKPTAPSVMLVLDKSGSMVSDPTGYWDHDANPVTPKQTRWKSLHQAIDYMTYTFDGAMDLGMSLFPSKAAKAQYDSTACPVEASVEVPVGPGKASSVLAAMPAADDVSSIKGATPAAKAITAATDELKSISASKPRFIVLVTDGAANCRVNAANTNALFELYDEDLPANVYDAFLEGIPTYVVGIGITNTTSNVVQDGNPDNTNAYQKLNEVAVSGGRPRPGSTKFYDTQNQLELQAAFVEIAAQTISCTIDLSSVPKFPDEVVISVNGNDFGAVGDCGAQHGWTFTNPDNDQIKLCGAACSEFQMTGSLTAEYHCPG